MTMPTSKNRKPATRAGKRRQGDAGQNAQSQAARDKQARLGQAPARSTDRSGRKKKQKPEDNK